MRTTVTLDDDVAALIESERARTGESFRQAVNRLLRRGGRRTSDDATVPLACAPGATDTRRLRRVRAHSDSRR